MTQDTEQETEMEVSESVSAEGQETDMTAKTLVVYFSATGTTKPLAEYSAEILEADIYEIVAEEPYTEADLAYYTGGRADQEQDDPNARPAISGSVENMDSYDTVLIGYPIWHGQAPRIISTFLESYDFSGKTIVPFCTSHSSGTGSSATNLHVLCPDTVEWVEGRRFEAGTSRDTIEEWLSSIGIK
ncbi:MAG: flavodoxin [Lachnospiraceae bacterium]|nr:flavodoxin [Lachnospiraceae bacterium]